MSKRRTAPAKYWIVRLQSNRGTDMTKCLKLPGTLTKRQVRDSVESFTDEYVANTAIHEYSVTYKPFRMPKRPALIKQYDAACKAKNKATERWNVLRSALNPTERE